MLGPVVQMIKHLFMHCQIYIFFIFIRIEKAYGLILQGCYGVKYSFGQDVYIFVVNDYFL